MELARIRDFFPVAQRLIYCNHAAVSPLATPTRQAMERTIAEVNEFGALHWKDWATAIEAARNGMAALVGAQAAELALVKNTSEGLSILAQGLDWRPGDTVVGFGCEFPANLYPWLALRPRGVQVELLPEAALLDLDRIRKACQGARLLAMSFVQYLTGFRADLAAIGSICRETGTLFVVDGIQGLGAFPLNVKRCGIHALAADGHKWLTGPEGAGFLFVDEAVLDQVAPSSVGWLSVEAWEDFAAALHAARAPAGLRWRAGAARFECGTLNMVGTVGLAAAIQLLCDAGIERIANHLLALGTHLAQALRSSGCELLLLSEEPRHRSGITSFRHPDTPSEVLVAELERQHIVCANRNGWVRCSPHLYNTFEEVDRLTAAVDAYARG